MSLFSSGDVAAFKAEDMLLAARRYWPNVTLTDAYLLRQLQVGEARVARTLRTYLEPTKVFPFTPSSGDITALGGMAYDEEPGYDYDSEFFQSDTWGYIVLRQRPLISVDFVRFAYPSPATAFYTFPADWIRPDKKYGVLRFVPASAAFNGPLNAFIMQAMGGGRTIPSMIQVQYTAGLTGVKTDPKWADLLDVIYKSAVMSILKSAYLPQSGSISVDGMSQSMGMDLGKVDEQIGEILMGPKGSNGGLFTAIHGIVGTFAGTLA